MAKTTLAATGRRWFVGTFGNLSVSPTMAAKLAAAKVGDVIAFGDKVEPNLKIVGVSLLADALGAATTLTVKVGNAVLINAVPTEAAVASYIPADDIPTDVNQEVTLTVGGGAATGSVKLKLHYEVIGNL